MSKTFYVILALIIIVALIGIFQMGSVLFGNKQKVDFTNRFNHAIIYSPDGGVVAEGKVDSWTDFEDGDQLQVKIDGIIYLTHSSLIILSTN